MDTFVDSSWYYLRYCSPGNEQAPFDVEEVRQWMPVAQYVGGVEHAILHLLYSRFFTKVLHDMGMVDFIEPFAALLNQGSVINQGKAMSKSLGNGVDLGRRAGQLRGRCRPADDALRRAARGRHRLGRHVSRHRMRSSCRERVRVVRDGASGPDGELAEPLARTVAHIVDDSTRLAESFRFNVAISRLHELTKALGQAVEKGEPTRKGLETLAILLAPYAPFAAEECWALLGHDVAGGDSVHAQSWPTADPALLVE